MNKFLSLFFAVFCACMIDYSHAETIRPLEIVAVKLNHAKNIELRDLIRDAGFKIDAIVYVDGANIAAEMIELGLARSDDGKSNRLGWCG